MRTIVQQWVTLILIGIVWQKTGSAQSSEVGVGVGVSAYDGDFLSSKLELVKTMSLSGQLQLTHHFDQRWRGQLFFARGKVSARDEEITGNDRTLSFATHINEMGGSVMDNFVPFDAYGQYGRRYSIYARTRVA